VRYVRKLSSAFYSDQFNQSNPQKKKMETSITVAIISASASIVVAALSFVLSKRAERKALLQQRKLAHYQELLDALSDLAVDGTDKANQRFANAVNTMGSRQGICELSDRS